MRLRRIVVGLFAVALGLMSVACKTEAPSQVTTTAPTTTTQVTTQTTVATQTTTTKATTVATAATTTTVKATSSPTADAKPVVLDPAYERLMLVNAAHPVPSNFKENLTKIEKNTSVEAIINLTKTRIRICWPCSKRRRRTGSICMYALPTVRTVRRRVILIKR